MKKEMSNDRKLTAQIAAAYFDSKVYIHDDRLHPSNKIQSIIGVTKTKIVYSESSSSFFDGWFHISACQLILKKLEDISDEDAIEVAWILDVNYSNNPDSEQWYDLDGLINYVKEEIIDGSRLADVVELIDYLRSKSYDCGYGSIPSLIEAGIAIVDTKIDVK